MLIASGRQVAQQAGTKELLAKLMNHHKQSGTRAYE